MKSSMSNRLWHRLKFLLLGILAVSLVVGCQPQPPESQAPATVGTPAPTPITLNGAGASFPLLFYTRLFGEYNKLHPDVFINYQDIGSAAGVQQMIAATVDFGASDIAMTDDEIAQVAQGVVLVPMTAGSVAVAYNLPGLESGLRLSQTAYTDIFLGEITQWNDPAIAATNPGAPLPDLPIILVHRSDGSGTTAVLTAHLSAISPKWEEAVGTGLNVAWPAGVGIKSNAGVSAQIQQAEGAIGYVEYSYAKKLGLSIAALENQAGNFVEPNTEAVKAGLSEVEFGDDLRGFVPNPASPEAYPLVTYTWLLLFETYDDPTKAETIKGVVQWGLTEAQGFSEELGYVPLPEAVVEKAMQAVERIMP
ncbi:MAG: phosphate ABC transporter substrate-binding protein PstS [Nodosilinea sp.]